MVKEVILLPEGKCPLAFIRELGVKFEDSWVFLHKNAVSFLENAADKCILRGDPLVLSWNPTKELSKITVGIQYNEKNIWNKMISVETDMTNFILASEDPEYIYFIKMEN